MPTPTDPREPSDPAGPAADRGAHVPPEDLLVLHRSHDLAGLPGGGSAPVRAARSLLRRLLGPLLDRQSQVNASAARAISRVWEESGRNREDHARLKEDTRGDVAALRRDLEAVQAMIQAQGAQFMDHLSALRGEQLALHGHFEASRHRTREAIDAFAAVLASRMDALARDHAAGLEGLREAVLAQVRWLGEERDRRIVQLERARAQMRIALARLDAGRAEPGASGSERGAPAAPASDDAFYASFEDRFRGTREMVRGRLETYLPLVRASAPLAAGLPLLDLGAGRGEWVELLRENRIQALGVDRNSVFVGEARAHEIPVEEGDALARLAASGDASLGGVSAFHLVEHLPFDLVVRLVDDATRALAPGGILLLETPNPANLLVGGYRFWLDPTHRNPLPSPVLAFLLESRGFSGVRVLELHPYEEEPPLVEDSEIARRYNRLFHAAQDYAVVGVKA